MAKKTITFSLDPDSIDNAIKKVEEYKKEVEKKCETLRIRVAQAIQDKAQAGFAGAVVDDLLKGARMANVTVGLGSSLSDKEATLVIANGTDAVWVEFGAGVYHNGAAGSSPNPYGSELGFTIGGYGTKGTQNVWGFYEDGALHLTHGTPAKMPLFNAVVAVSDDIADIAKEVFS